MLHFRLFCENTGLKLKLTQREVLQNNARGCFPVNHMRTGFHTTFSLTFSWALANKQVEEVKACAKLMH